jgi:hypothetical protein
VTAPGILRPCPFCGEREHLTIDTEGFERVAVRGGVVAEVKWIKGHPTGQEYVDAIHCQVCDSVAALDVWNGTRPASDYAALRDFDPEPQQVAA